MQATERKQRPEGLGPAGADLWDGYASEFALTGGEARLLLEAARTADELDLMAASLAGDDPVVPGSTGQPRPNPMLDEVRRHRATLSTLLSLLKEDR